MLIIQNGGEIKLHSSEWVNKSSGRGETELIVDDGKTIQKYSYPYWFPYTPYKMVFPRLFPWANFSADEEFFEVKGIMTPTDNVKILALINAGYSVTIGREDGKFTACDYWGKEDNGTEIFDLCTGSDSLLCHCNACGKYWFMGSNGIYTCQCCGTYDGDHHFDVVMEYYNYRSSAGKVEGGDTRLWDVARQARFEHGEIPNTIQWR